MLSYARVAQSLTASARAGILTMLCVVTGYLGASLSFGMVAWLIDARLRADMASVLRWSAFAPLAVGLALVIAGAYQLTPAKSACLRGCRWPLTAILRGFSTWRLGALRLGATNGAWCIGCCAGLMVTLFALES